MITPSKFVILTLAFIALPPHISTVAANEAEVIQNVPIVGMDQNHQSFVKFVPIKTFKFNIRAIAGSIHNSVLVALKSHNQEAVNKPSWELQTIGVGVGVNAQIGLGPIWNVNITPRLRLIYSNSTNPIYPNYN